MTGSVPNPPGERRLPALGLIEGFFGAPWPEEERLRFAPFLGERGFDHYFFAPKAEPLLRKRWREEWPEEFLARLRFYARHFRAHGVRFGVGLSPFELHHLPQDRGEELLRRKVACLEGLGVELIGLFFDDMPVHDGLASAQLRAIEVVRSVTRARIVFCPAFYSPDPILEKVFGKRPERYWEEIRAAPAEIDFAWTGPKVISEEIPLRHLGETAALLGRRPFLWDNLFANDGPRNCKFLKLRPPHGRVPEAAALTAGWAWNPMNQPAISRLVLDAGWRTIRGAQEPDKALEESFRALCEPGLAEFLLRKSACFLNDGLDRIEASEKAEWAGHLADSFPGDPVARELAAWLQGRYVVGAECLTD